MEGFIVVKTTVIGEIFQTFDAAKKVADALAEESTDQKYAYHVVGLPPCLEKPGTTSTTKSSKRIVTAWPFLLMSGVLV